MYINLIKHLTDIVVYTKNSTQDNTGDAVVQTPNIYIICIVTPVGIMSARKATIKHTVINQVTFYLCCHCELPYLYRFARVAFSQCIINGIQDSKNSVVLH